MHHRLGAERDHSSSAADLPPFAGIFTGLQVMVRLSVVVPLMPEDTASFDDTVASILRNLPDRCQLIVAHDGSYADPHDLRSIGVQTVNVRGAATYGELCAAAISHCAASVVHWVRPGITVDEGWCDSAIEQFANPQIASVTPLMVTERQPDRILTAGITCGVGYRVKLVGCGNRLEKGERLSPLGPSAWAAYYRRSALRAVLQQLDGWAGEVIDLELALSFRYAGWLNVVDVDSIVTHERPERLAASYRDIHGRDTQRLLWRHHPGSLVGSMRSTIGAAAGELLAGMFAPRHGLHGLQRLSAGLGWTQRRALHGSLELLRRTSIAEQDESPALRPRRTAA